MITKGIFLFIYPFEDIVYVLNVCFGSEADCMETKKILGIVLCISIIVLVSCVKSEDAKFIPIELEIESTDLTRIGNDEFTIPAEGGSFTICSAEKGGELA